MMRLFPSYSHFFTFKLNLSGDGTEKWSGWMIRMMWIVYESCNDECFFLNVCWMLSLRFFLLIFPFFTFTKPSTNSFWEKICSLQSVTTRRMGVIAFSCGPPDSNYIWCWLARGAPWKYLLFYCSPLLNSRQIRTANLSSQSTRRLPLSRTSNWVVNQLYCRRQRSALLDHVYW